MPKRSKGVGIYLAILAALALIAMMLLSLQTEPQTYRYSEVLSWFQQNKVQEFVIDLNSGELQITKMEGKPVDIQYRVPHTDYFLQEVENG